MTDNLRFDRAAAADAEEIFALYHSLIHMPYSTWSEDYPTREIVEGDLMQNDVRVLREESGRVIAAIVLCEEDEIAPLAPWYPDVTRWIGLSRLGVAADWQGRGIARRMLAHAMEAARTQGYEAVRFLVAKSNPIAQRSYAKLGFDVCGEGELWGGTWLCYQKRL